MSLLRPITLKPLLLLCAALALPSAAQVPQKTFNYLLDGQAVSGWNIVLGDPDNWSTSVKNRVGESASGKLSVEPANVKAEGDALKFTWSPKKKLKGVAALYGSPIDLSAFENDVALVIDLKVDVMPDKGVTIGMDCGYPCRSELNVRKNITKLSKGEWTSLPIPLNCFSKEGADLKKINGPFVMSTEGKFTVEIANIRLQKLAEGDKGCAQ